MKVCLVSSPTASEFGPRIAGEEAVRLIAEQAPLGILTLAAILDLHGISAKVVDLNRTYYQYLRSDAHRGGADFCSFVAAELAPKSFDVWGFSTICSSYPLTLRIAERVKQSHPGSVVMLGGPQASVVDVATLEAFPFIDFIVRGEADETLPVLLNRIRQKCDFEGSPGVTWRRGAHIVRNPAGPVVLDLDKLPMPAFHQCPQLGFCSAVPLELGRGCPFACTFCSTNDFFRRRFRLKSPARMIEQMRAIRDTYGNTRFELIHDMFTVDRKRVVEFCEALLASGDKFEWNCSARTDCLDDELIALMRRAGCAGIFFGIETGSPQIQRSIGKDLDLTEAASRIHSVVRHGIRPTASLITGFPGETRDDLRQTVAFLMDAARFEVTRPQLHILAPLAGTPIYEEYRDGLGPPDIFSDVSYHGWTQGAADRDMIRAHRAVFPNFYAVPTPLDRQYIKELRDFIQNAVLRCRPLLIALHQDSGDLLELFDAWRAWLSENRPRPGRAAAVPYYARAVFARDLLEFVEHRYLPRAKAARVIRALLDFQRAHASKVPHVTCKRATPRHAKGVRLVRLGADYQRILTCLRDAEPLATVPRRRVLLAMRDIGDQQVRVSQLGPLSVQLLALCDGTRSPGQIARRLRLSRRIADIPRRKACLFGLAVLQKQGLIEL